jgi:tetratricopeptide (TPR) repeat protein
MSASIGFNIMSIVSGGTTQSGPRIIQRLILVSGIVIGSVVPSLFNSVHAGEIANRCYREMKTEKPSERAILVCREAADASWEGTSDRARSFVNLAWGLGKLLRWQESLDAALASNKLRPNYVNALAYIGQALGRLGRFDEATSATREAIGLDPDFGFAYGILAGALADAGHYNEAVLVARMGVNKLSNPIDVRVVKAALAAETGEGLENAEADARTGVEKFPDNPITHAVLGSVLYRKGSYQEAAEYLKRAIQIGPDSPGKRIRLAEIFLAMKRKADSDAELQHALSLKPAASVAAYIKSMLGDQ